MTISSTNRKAGPFSGTGLQTAYPFTFKVFATSDMLVVQTDANGVETILALTTNYTVALNSDQNASPGGTVTMLVAPPIGYLLTLSSAVSYTQGQSIPNNGGFYPKVIEDALDRLTIEAQQVAEQVGRAVKVNISSSTTPDQLIAQLNTDAANAATSASNAAASATNAANSAAAAATFNPALYALLAGSATQSFQVLTPTAGDNTNKAASTAFAQSTFVNSGADGVGKNVVVITGSTALTPAAHSGKSLNVLTATAGSNLSLPLNGGNTAPVGFNTIIGPNTNGINLTLPAASTVSVYHADGSVAIAPGGSLALPSGNGKAWAIYEFSGLYRIVVVGRTVVANAVNANEAVALGQFVASLGAAQNAGVPTTGYLEIPTPGKTIYLQFIAGPSTGSIAGGANVTSNLSWPIQFPTAISYAFPGNYAPPNLLNVTLTSVSPTGVSVNIANCSPTVAYAGNPIVWGIGD